MLSATPGIQPTPVISEASFGQQGGMIDIGLLPKHPSAPSIPAGLNNRDQIVRENGAAYLWSPTIGIVHIEGADHREFAASVWERGR
jgi:hypothetical protein